MVLYSSPILDGSPIAKVHLFCSHICIPQRRLSSAILHTHTQNFQFTFTFDSPYNDATNLNVNHISHYIVVVYEGGKGEVFVQLVVTSLLSLP